jgi:hypothetical protein
MPRKRNNDNDEEASNELAFFGSLSSRRTIHALSDGMNVDLNPAQRFTAMGAPLTSFENPVIDDLYRDVFWVFYTLHFGVLDPAREGREPNWKLLMWLLDDPLIDKRRLPFMNMMISAASVAYEVTSQLLQSPSIKVSMSGLGQAEQMEDEADSLEDLARAMSHPNAEIEFEDEGDGDEQDEGDGAGDGQDDFDDNEGEDDQDGSGDSEDEDGEGEGQSEFEDAPQPTPEELQDQADALRNKAAKIRAKAEQKLDKALGSEMSGFNRSGALQSGTDFGESVKSFLASWGFEEGPGVMLSIEEIRALMAFMGQNNLNELTTLMGRVYGVAVRVMEGRSPVEVLSQATGLTKNILDLYPDQMALLATDDPDVNAFYMGEFIRDGLEGPIKVSQAKNEGVFLGLDDGSKSMETQDLPVGENKFVERRIGAKALALGLARAARENGQPFSLATFGSTNQISPIVNNNTPLPKLLEYGIKNFGGGTNFNFAMKMLLDMFEAQDEQDRYLADLLVITDGEGGLSDEKEINRLEWLKEKYGVRLWVLLVADDSNNSLEEYADLVIQFDDLNHIAEVLAKAIWEAG